MAAGRRILIVNRHYWPDVVTYGQMLRQIAARWAADGHEVDVFAAMPSYRPESGIVAPAREVDRGVAVRRVRLFPFKHAGVAARLLNSVPFFIGLIWHMLARRVRGGTYDFVLVSTNPPIVEALLVRLLCAVLGGRIIYHVQDIHPEVEVSAGVLRQGGMVERWLRGVDASVARAAAVCVTLSADMRDRLLQRQPADRRQPRIAIINNFSFDLDESPALPPALVRDRKTFRLIFAGNVGFFQGLEAVVAAMHELVDLTDLELVIVGNGVARDELAEQAGALLGTSIHFVPFQPMSVAHALVEDADLALISLKPGVIRLAYPSKTMTYVATGTPILALIEPDSELASVIVGNELGFVVDQGDAMGLAASIRRAHARRAQLESERPTRKATGVRLFGQAQALESWSQLLREL